MNATDDRFDRALGALQGLALGDALGMPTQSFSRAEIADRFGTVDRLLGGPTDQPIAPGMPAGSITDDTEQALFLAQELVTGSGRVDPHRFARALSDWQRKMKARGSLDLLGPSTQAAIELVEQGVDPALTGRNGVTNGAAMRIAPVGIAVPATDLTILVDAVEQACLVTHHTGLAMAGAAAVAGAVSAGLDGASVGAALDLGLQAAELAAQRGQWQAGADVAFRTRWARTYLASVPDDEVLDAVDAGIGTSLATQESVVAALALADRFASNPLRALTIAASVGGDTDTIAAICGAVLGACLGTAAWPTDQIETVVSVNDLHLPDLASKLLALREVVDGGRPVGQEP